MGRGMVKRVLMVAFHYPPCAGSSGVQRALKFSCYLPEEGWDPLVLTVNRGAYAKTSDQQLAEIPEDIVVKRSLCFDAARHLSVGGRYPGFLALPDRWSSWRFSGIRVGMRLIKRYRPQVIWSTFPIATAHLIAGELQARTGLPWVADFRDSMTEPGYPADPEKRKQFLAIERKACENAESVVFNAPGAIRMYAERYPEVPPNRWVEIANGYDDATFPEAIDASVDEGSITLLHSGIIYPSERDPTQFFDALAELRNEGVLDKSQLRVVLRATGHDGVLGPMIDTRSLDDMVHLEPPIDYSDALQEMLAASCLLLFQASNCNHQIPAKLYEYMRANKPVLGLTDPAGDTAGKMREVGLTCIARLDDKARIKAALVELVRDLRAGTAALPDAELVKGYSRREQTTRLAQLLDAVAAR